MRTRPARARRAAAAAAALALIGAGTVGCSEATPAGAPAASSAAAVHPGPPVEIPQPREAWRVPMEEASRSAGSTELIGEPAGGRVVVQHGDAVVSLGLADGSVQWRRPLPADSECSGPRLDGLVVCQTATEVTLLDGETGQVSNTLSFPDELFSSVAVSDVGVVVTQQVEPAVETVDGVDVQIVRATITSWGADGARQWGTTFTLRPPGRSLDPYGGRVHASGDLVTLWNWSDVRGDAVVLDAASGERLPGFGAGGATPVGDRFVAVEREQNSTVYQQDGTPLVTSRGTATVPGPGTGFAYLWGDMSEVRVFGDDGTPRWQAAGWPRAVCDGRWLLSGGEPGLRAHGDDGRLLWRWAGGVERVGCGTDQVFVGDRDRVTALRAADGSEQWQHPADGYVLAATGAGLLIEDDDDLVLLGP